jgi:hypothetical protein
MHLGSRIGMTDSAVRALQSSRPTCQFRVGAVTVRTVIRVIIAIVAAVLGCQLLGAQEPMTTGKIVITKLTGKATIETAGVSTLAVEGESLRDGATIKTDPSSSAVVAFANGVVVSVSGDSEFGIISFNQDPFTEAANLATMVAEPSVSRLSLRLDRGDAIVRVKHLNHDKGSTFVLRCPGGAAGVRGTTFRMSVRPAANRSVDVTIEAIEGQVAFQPNGQPNVMVVPGRKYLATLPVAP